MRLIILLLFLLSISWAVSFGRSVLTIERAWEIQSEGPFEFTGALVVNDSNQRVVSITTDPGAEIISRDGNILIEYEGNGNIILHAEAVVEVDYETDIYTDSPLPEKGMIGEGLIAADEDIEAKARELATNSSALTTVKDVVNWVHSNVEYDISYFGRVRPATEVFRDRKGVCVEYSHLLISMLRSLGMESRYVSGYVFTEEWQPHAWAEVDVPGYGWLPVDATLGQAGVLDNTHLAIQKEDDQNKAYDVLVSDDSNAALSVTDSMNKLFLSADPEGISLTSSIDESWTVEVAIKNTRTEYVFGSYWFSVPEYYNGEESSVVLLRPLDEVRLYYVLNRSFFDDGFVYEIPVMAGFNDISEKRTFTIDRTEKPEKIPEEFYAIPLGIIVLIIIAVITSIRPKRKRGFRSRG